jgi:hypothetical protein
MKAKEENNENVNESEIMKFSEIENEISMKAKMA